MKLTGTIAAMVFAADVAHAQWQPDARLTIDAAFSSTTFNNARSIAASSNVLHVVWFDERDGNQEIYSKRSLDAGLTWSGDARLTNNAAISKFPSVAIAGAVVHVVWEEYRNGNAEVYHKRSIDSGMTWSGDMRLTINSATSLSPCVAATGAVVNVIWFDARHGNHEVFAKRSIDAGETWSADTRLTFNASPSVYAALAASGQTVHVAWEEYRDGPNAEVYYKRSADSGETWGADIRLTTNAARSFSPSIAAFNQSVHVVWFDDRDGNTEIYDKRSTNDGLNWSSDVRLTNAPANSEFPCVAVSCSNVHVTWIDERDGNLEIYYKRSATGGATWEPDVRLTNDPFRATEPTLAPSGSAVHVVWTDSRDGNVNGNYNGNYEVYYKRQPAGNPIAGDADNDGAVDIDDLLAVVNSWGPCPSPCPPRCAADIAPMAGNCAVDVDDLLAVINGWGGCS